MTYFNLRKRAEEEPEGPVEAIDTEPEEEAAEDDEEQGPVGLGAALWAGIAGPGRWLAAHGRIDVAWALYPGSVWAVGFYGGWVAVAVPAVWLVMVLAFMPREAKDRVAAWIERRTPGNQVAEDSGDPAEEAPIDPLVTVMWTLIGDAPGVHVKTLAAHLQAAVPEQLVARAAVRAKLGALGIPVRASVRDAAGRVNEGVHRADLEAWQQALPGPSPDPGPGPVEDPVATPVTCDVVDSPTPVATPLSRLRGLLSRGAA